MASTRLRRTFNYPADSDDDDAVEEGMDSQDQATLLTTLSTRDKSSTTLYTRLIVAFPLLAALLHVPLLFRVATCVPSAAAIASLVGGAYALWFVPLPAVRVRVTSVQKEEEEERERERERGGRRSSAAPDSSVKAKRRAMARSATGFSSSAQSPSHTAPRPVPYLSDRRAAALATYIVPVNAALCALFAVRELARGAAWTEGVGVGGGYLPGLVLVVVLWARRELRAVDLGELERLRYRRA